MTRVDSDFTADIIGLQVAECGSDARVVTVRGEVDTLTAPRLASFLNTQLSAARVVVVDLDGVEFLGSAGLSALFEANELATSENRVLQLVCHSRIVKRSLPPAGARRSWSVGVTGQRPCCRGGVQHAGAPWCRAWWGAGVLRWSKNASFPAPGRGSQVPEGCASSRCR